MVKLNLSYITVHFKYLIPQKVTASPPDWVTKREFKLKME